MDRKKEEGLALLFITHHTMSSPELPAGASQTTLTKKGKRLRAWNPFPVTSPGFCSPCYNNWRGHFFKLRWSKSTGCPMQSWVCVVSGENSALFKLSVYRKGISEICAIKTEEQVV